MRATINSEKHIRQQSLTPVLETNVLSQNLAVAVANPSGGNTQVRIGAVIKAVYVELWIIADSMTTGSFTFTIEKLVSGQDTIASGEMDTLHTYENKKNIFYITQGVSGDQNSNPIPIIRQWIKIPKGKQRWGLGDSLVINFKANVSDHQICGNFIYKEYY